MSRSRYYRAQKPKPQPTPRPSPPRALFDNERANVLATLDSEEFMDKAPAQVFAKLLEDGVYLCSTRTMYRILDENDQVRERRAQRQHPAYTKPQLVATAPNQVWTWDITKLPGPTKGTYFSLYVLLDLYSRYIVGWQVATRESAAVYQRLVEACVVPEQLTIHSDRGSPMTAKSTALLYVDVDLGIAKSHSRPYTSNDNPYFEANFRTLKYRPDMPDQLGSLEHARQVVRALVVWYDDEHYHVGALASAPRRRALRARAGNRRRAAACSTPRTLRTPNASCAAGRCRRRRRLPHGSTRHRRRRLSLSNFHEACFRLVDTHGQGSRVAKHRLA